MTTTTIKLLKIVIYFMLNIIRKYNKFSTYIICYNKLSNSSRAKLVGRHWVLADFLPNILNMQIIYIYNLYDIYIIYINYIYIKYINIYIFIYIYMYV